MARKKIKNQKEKSKITFKKLKIPMPWLENKIAAARKVSEHRTARAIGRFGAPAGVALLATLVIYSLFLPKDRFQLAKERLIKNPNDLEAHLLLAEEYLNNNQIEEAERELLLAQENFQFPVSRFQFEPRILGETADSTLEELWQRKVEAKPEDIRRLISYWEGVIAEKPNYRDAYFQLAILNFKIFENEKAKECLGKALELDPNFEPAKELEKIIQ